MMHRNFSKQKYLKSQKKAEIIDQNDASLIMCFDCVIVLFNAYG